MPSFQSPSRLQLIIGLIIGIFAASTAAIFIRFSYNEGAPSIVIAAGRLLLASLFLAPYALKRHHKEIKSLSQRNWKWIVLAGSFLALHFATWIASIEFTSIISSVVLVSTTPLWVAMIAPLFLHERLDRFIVIGLILSLIGTGIIGLSDLCRNLGLTFSCSLPISLFDGKSLQGDILALVGAWMAAGYMLVGRKVRSQLTLVPYIFLVYGTAAIILLALMFVLGYSPFGYSPWIYLWILLLALIPQLIGHTIFNWTLKYLPASFVSISLLGEPIGSAILAFIIFQEVPGWIKTIGAIVLLAGIWLASRNRAVIS